jgi:hypothetical protein
MQRERAASALERGLPAPALTGPPKAVSARAASRAWPSSNPPGGAGRATLSAKNSSERMPLAVKLLGLGLGLLGLVYGLTLFRDHKSGPPAGTAPASMTATTPAK